MMTDLELDSIPTGKVDHHSKVLNALTIDVEEYFQVSNLESRFPCSGWDRIPSRVEKSTAIILDQLASREIKATFFILGWVAQRQPQIVRRIHAEGHEVASHGQNHQLIYRQTPDQFREDLRLSRTILEDLTGQAIVAYRAPSFSIVPASLWALDVLIEEGFTIDSSIYPVHHDRYGIRGTPPEPHQIERASGVIWEYPPPVTDTFLGCIPVGGGGYFRLYPYGLTQHLLRSVNRKKRPFAVYLHPWELDPSQPRHRVGILNTFRHYVGLSRTEHRLNRLLDDFSFGTISQSLERHLQEKLTGTDDLLEEAAQGIHP